MTSDQPSEQIRIGVRVKKRQGKDYMLAASTEVYDVDTGKLLPTQKASIIVEADNLVMISATFELSEVEMIDEV